MGNVDIKEILLVVLVLVVLFGATRLPKALGGLGKGIHMFKKGMKGESLDEDADGDGKDGEKK